MATQAQNRLTPFKIVSYALVVTWLVIAAFPFLWTFWGSFKVQGDFFSKADWTNALYGVFTTGSTFIDGFAVSNGLCIGFTARISTLAALGLR